MKEHCLSKLLMASLCLLCFGFLFSPQAANGQEKVDVNFCIPNASVYPFFLFENGVISGINPDMMKAAFSQKTLQKANLKFVQRPWKRCNMELQSGGIDIIIGGYEEERDRVGIYPNELGFELKDMIVSTAGVCFITAEGQQMQKTLEGLAGLSAFNVGVEAGFSQDHDPDIQPKWLVIYNHLEKYRLLEMGRVDAIVQVCSMDEYPIATKAEAFGYQDFITLTPPYLSNPAYAVFSGKFASEHPQLAKDILQSLQAVDKTKIYEKYRSTSE